MTAPINLFLEIVLGLVALPALLGFVWLLRGPSLPDRVGALDLFAAFAARTHAV